MISIQGRILTDCYRSVTSLHPFYSEAHTKLLRLIYQILWMGSRLFYWYSLTRTVLPVQCWDRSGFSYKQRAPLGVLVHKRPQFAGMFPIAFAALPEHLFCFVLCLGFWKECVSTADEPCKRPLHSAQSCTAPPTGLTSFMNKLSSLFRTLLALASRWPCSPKALKMSGL